MIPVLGVAAIVPALYYFIPRSKDAESIEEDARWKPTLADITATIGNAPGSGFKDTRHGQFAKLFQQRFRDQQHAVGLRFISETKMKAMFAPIIPRWDMARVSVIAESEAYSLFGRHFDVDIFETYITSPMKKLAELRIDPRSGKRTVRFDSKFTRDPPSPEWVTRRIRMRTMQIFFELLPTPNNPAFGRPMPTYSSGAMTPL
jgi:hypothetical protein